MSDSQSALAGARFYGIVSVAEAGLVGMITLRGDAKAKTFNDAVKESCGLDLPGQRQINREDDRALIWMSPDEWLLVVPYTDADTQVARLEKELAGSHSLAVNVSDARCVFDVNGADARDVLAKLFPVDLSKEGFSEGMIRRSRLAQVPAAVWMEGPDTFRVVCFRSVAQYVFDLLSGAAAEGGEVGHLS